MTEKKTYKNDLVGCLYPGKKGNVLATINLPELKNKRYLVEPVSDGGEIKFKMYLSKIGGLKGEQIRDLDNYDACVTFYERKSAHGVFYVSSKDKDEKKFILSPAREGKNYSFLLFKEKEVYTKEDKGEAAAPPVAKPLREFP